MPLNKETKPNQTISMKHQLFVYTKLNGQAVLFLTILSNITHLFAHIFDVKQFYLTHIQDAIRCYHSGSEWIGEQWQCIPCSPKLQD